MRIFMEPSAFMNGFFLLDNFRTQVYYIWLDPFTVNGELGANINENTAKGTCTLAQILFFKNFILTWIMAMPESIHKQSIILENECCYHSWNNVKRKKNRRKSSDNEIWEYENNFIDHRGFECSKIFQSRLMVQIKF